MRKSHKTLWCGLLLVVLFMSGCVHQRQYTKKVKPNALRLEVIAGEMTIVKGRESFTELEPRYLLAAVECVPKARELAKQINEHRRDLTSLRAWATLTVLVSGAGGGGIGLGFVWSNNALLLGGIGLTAAGFGISIVLGRKMARETHLIRAKFVDVLNIYNEQYSHTKACKRRH